ncbi:SPFH domain-containing protein [Catellatospora vulcania]|uniref:SPFH domain-containing protein n=1 Tax=Catellatospora vulcania TaxID=1460450 RepID=UPI0012D3E64D|nr:SPFH domain-containing protein [Catellatospora vulcania]
MDYSPLMTLTAFLPLAARTALWQVPEDEVWIVERHRRFHRALAAGRRLAVPLLDRVKAKIDLTQQMLLWPPAPPEGTTEQPVGDAFAAGDGGEVEVRMRILWRVTDPVQAAYQPHGPNRAIDDLAAATLRHLIADMPQEAAMTSRTAFDQELTTALSAQAGQWAEVGSVRISEVLARPAPSPSRPVPAGHGTAARPRS